MRWMFAPIFQSCPLFSSKPCSTGCAFKHIAVLSVLSTSFAVKSFILPNSQSKYSECLFKISCSESSVSIFKQDHVFFQWSVSIMLSVSIFHLDAAMCPSTATCCSLEHRLIHCSGESAPSPQLVSGKHGHWFAVRRLNTDSSSVVKPENSWLSYLAEKSGQPFELG